jgi:hypothetical protein
VLYELKSPGDGAGALFALTSVHAPEPLPRPSDDAREHASPRRALAVGQCPTRFAGVPLMW